MIEPFSKASYDQARAILEMAVKDMEAIFGGDIGAAYMTAGMLIQRGTLAYKATMSEADAMRAGEHAVMVGVTSNLTAPARSPA